jgi:outer membrane protein assembly factor BamA
MPQHDSYGLEFCANVKLVHYANVNAARRQPANQHSFSRLLLCRLFLASLLVVGGLQPALGQGTATAPLSPSQSIGSYEGQPVTAVEVIGQPDSVISRLEPLVRQKAGQPFSEQQVEASVAALKSEGKFQDVQLQVQPEAGGVRVRFVPQPALYFGVYEFPGAIRSFSYSLLLQIANYQSQEPYSAYDMQQAETSLTSFFRRAGFFQVTVHAQSQPDSAGELVNVDFQTDLKRRAKIGQIMMEGVSPAETAKLKKSLQTVMARLRGAYLKGGTDYTYKKLQAATSYLQRELSGNRHLMAQVKLVSANYHPETNLADVTFQVAPGPETNVAITGAHLRSWTRKKLIPIYQEKIINSELTDEGQRNLTSYFQSKGYFDVRVTTEFNRQPNAISLVYRIEQGPRHKVKDITVSGNQHFSDRQLLSSATVHKGRLLSHGSYSERLLRETVSSITDLYHAAGYSQAKILPRVTKSNGNLIIALAVEEGPRDIVETLQLQGNATVTLNQLAPKGLQLAPGKPYSQQLLRQDRNNIMARYLTLGYLTANFRATVKPVAHDPHRLDVTYAIYEGPKVETSQIILVGRQHTRPSLIAKTANIKVDRPLSQENMLAAESRLYALGPFDWAEVNLRRPIATQSQEAVTIKVHESKRNTITTGFGFEVINRGGSVPSGTVAVPGLPPVGLPSNFQTSEKTFYGPRGSIEYTRHNLRGVAESFTASGLAGRLDQRGSLIYRMPRFRDSSWDASITSSGENNSENPIFSAQTGQSGVQFQKPLDAKRTKNIILRYSFQYTSLGTLLIPGLVPPQDQQYRLSNLGAAYTRDTRDNPLNAHHGIYQSLDITFNTSVLGSSADFARFLGQVAYYKNVGHNIIWANSIRLGLEQAFNGSYVPLSEQFFTGGGSTLRGFPLNGAGPQRQLPACGDPSNPATCTQITVPLGGNQLFLLNSEFRIPLPFDFPAPIHKNLGIAVFYDGGNAFSEIGFHHIDFGSCTTNIVATGSSTTISTGAIRNCFTSSIGAGLRYSTPIGPIRIDIGHNLNGIPGIPSTQFFITLGQAF